jgi:hypothetical protein
VGCFTIVPGYFGFYRQRNDFSFNDSSCPALSEAIMQVRNKILLGWRAGIEKNSLK